MFACLGEFYALDKVGALRKGAELANMTLEERKPKAVRLSRTEKIRIAAAEYYHPNIL